jgi:cbb3-type cytochrome oxidase subunit 3
MRGAELITPELLLTMVIGGIIFLGIFLYIFRKGKR